MKAEALTKLGFSDKEIAVYLAILKNGKISPANIAKATSLKRTTAYSVAEELVKRGVVTVDLAGKGRHLLALPPSGLEQLAIRERKQLEEKEKQIKSAIKELESFAKEVKYTVPKITFITEDELDSYLYRQTPTWNASLKNVEPIWWGYQDPTFVERYQKWIDWYWQQSSGSGISLRLLTNQSDIEKEMTKKKYSSRKMKYWGNNSDITATTWVNGDHLVMIITNKRPHFLVEIVDATLAHNQREVFRSIWNSTK